MKRKIEFLFLLFVFALALMYPRAEAMASVAPGGAARSLVISPNDPNTIYAGLQGGGVYKSTDGGDSWSDVSTGLTNLTVWSLAIDPNNPNVLYAGTALFGAPSGTPKGVFKSVNGGAIWFHTGFADARVVVSLAIDPSNSSIVYAAIDTGGVFKSTNGGRDWSNTNLSGAEPFGRS